MAAEYRRNSMILPLRTAQMSRRQFGLTAGSLVTFSVVGAGCRIFGASGRSGGPALTARPSATSTTWTAGTHTLGLGGARDAVLHVPARAREGPVPLIVLLHGAGGSGRGFLRGLARVSGASGTAILAPDSRGRTWDALLAAPQSLIDVFTGARQSLGFGPDVEFLDQALARVFETVSVDATRIAIGGFSDGASYALSLGLINGDLFRRIVAFSPGFVIESPEQGRPEIFVSHGRSDEILPIDRCSRRIVPALRQRGYAVTFREFDGGHQVPDAIAREALAWAAD